MKSYFFLLLISFSTTIGPEANPIVKQYPDGRELAVSCKKSSYSSHLDVFIKKAIKKYKKYPHTAEQPNFFIMCLQEVMNEEEVSLPFAEIKNLYVVIYSFYAYEIQKYKRKNTLGDNIEKAIFISALCYLAFSLYQAHRSKENYIQGKEDRLNFLKNDFIFNSVQQEGVADSIARLDKKIQSQNLNKYFFKNWREHQNLHATSTIIVLKSSYKWIKEISNLIYTKYLFSKRLDELRKKIGVKTHKEFITILKKELMFILNLSKLESLLKVSIEQQYPIKG